MTEDKRKYTRRELQNLWGSGFKDKPDEIQTLSDFADCSEPEAAEMLKSFRRTAAAQKAAAAEEARKQKPPRKKKDHAPDEVGEVVEIEEVFPSDALIAAAVNSNHGFSRVLASGLARDRKRSVIVERVTRNGEYFYREKYTVYSYYKGKDEAIQQAKKRRLKLTVYSSDK